MKRRILSILLLLSLLSPCLSSAGYCSPGDMTMTLAEADRLDQIFDNLSSNLAAQEKLLQQANAKLRESDQAIIRLNEQLNKASSSINQAQSLLQKANESLAKSERDLKRAKIERDLAILAAVVMALRH